MPGFVTPDRLRKMIEAGEGQGVLLVDIRPDDQYRLDHLPGAVNIPLDEIESEAHRLETGRDVVFCCRNGVRSKVAAILAVDSGLDPERVFTLEGGICSYAGEVLLELPRLALFDRLTDPDGLLAAALNLEKGAWRFYTAASAMDLDSRTTRFLDKMAGLETDHAKALFDRLSPQARQDLSFDTYFKACSGDILEGGRSFDRVLAQISDVPAGHSVDEQVLDLAFEIETAAYDLYTQSSFEGDCRERSAFFLGLAKDERKHMAMITRFLAGPHQNKK